MKSNLFRFALVSACFLALAEVHGQSLALAPAAPQSVAERHVALDGLFHQYWEESLKADPEYASELGDKRWNDKLTDTSVSAENERISHAQSLLLKLATVDPTGLDDQDKTSRELLMRVLGDEIEAASYKEWQMPVSQMWGIQTRFPELARNLSFASVKDYDDWIARLHQIPAAFATASENMAIGLEEHRTPPRYLMEKVLPQVKELGTQKPAESPLALPLKNFPETVPAAERERIRAAVLEAIEKQVQPAYLRFARFLEVSYIPGCRKEPGAWALPDGENYYRYQIRHETTIDASPEQIHQIGLAQVARDEEQMLKIANQLGYKDLPSFRAALKADPKWHPASAEALLATYRNYITAMQAKLPTLFGHLPKAQLEVVEIPAYRAEHDAAAYYEAGTPDFSRPGRVTVNPYKATERSLVGIEAVSYHEGVPGHHLQISIAQEQKDLPIFRQHLGFTAFTEGWGLYSEQLGKDVGFYQNPVSDYGRLEADVWRSIRLVVDTGVHAQHWTREQMVDYFRAHSGLDEPNIQSEVDRYIAWPGQALGYKLGQMEILGLRSRAERELGAKFDLKSFHDQVLSGGALPLDLLDARMNAWIARQKSTK